MAPSVVGMNVSIVLHWTVIRVQDVIKTCAIHRECLPTQSHVDFAPGDFALSEIFLDVLNRYFKGAARQRLLFLRVERNPLSGVPQETREQLALGGQVFIGHPPEIDVGVSRRSLTRTPVPG